LPQILQKPECKDISTYKIITIGTTQGNADGVEPPYQWFREGPGKTHSAGGPIGWWGSQTH
jgi:hypothetical protein